MVAGCRGEQPRRRGAGLRRRRMTWREVAQRSAQIAAGFRKLGLQRGDRVALLLGNRIEFVLTMFAAAHAGLVTVLLSTRQQKPEIAYVLTDCGAKLLIHEAALADRLPDARDVPDLTHRIAVDDDPRVSRFSELADNAPLQAPAEVGEEDTAMILYTSGTTGRPKGAMLAHCNIIHSAMVFVSCLRADGGRSLDRRRAARACHRRGRQHHDHGPLRGRADHHGRVQGRGISESRGARARHLHGDGAGDVQSLPAAAGFRQLRSSSWRIGGFGGAPMPIATIEKLDAKIPGLKLMNCYGATETTSPSTIMPGELTASHIDSVGLPCPGAQIIVVDADGHELPRGEIGEIWIHGGFGHQGLLEQSEGDRRKLHRRLLAFRRSRLDRRENFVRVFDRQKDMINRGGLKIYSAEVESVLARPSRRGRERHHRKTLPGAGRARARRRGDAPRGQRRGAARLVRRAAVGLQGAGDDSGDAGPAAAQCQRQGDEAAAPRERLLQGRRN